MVRFCMLLGAAIIIGACDNSGPDHVLDISVPWDRIDGRIAVATNESPFAVDVIDVYQESIVHVVAPTAPMAPNKLFSISGLSWSPSGDSLTFGAIGPVNRELWPYQVYAVSASDGSGLRNINPDPYLQQSDPAWGSDGRIAWIATDGLRINAHVYSVGPAQFGSSPGWSPDGSTLLVSVRDNTSQGALHRFNPTDSSLVPVLQSTGGFSDEIFMNPRYSPDGTRIVYSRWGSAVGVSGAEIWVMAADGSQRTRITHDHYDRQPCWSPDGYQIAFIRDGEPHVMNADGSAIEQLLSIQVQAIAWTATASRR